MRRREGRARESSRDARREANRRKFSLPFLHFSDGENVFSAILIRFSANYRRCRLVFPQFHRLSCSCSCSFMLMLMLSHVHIHAFYAHVCRNDFPTRRDFSTEINCFHI